MSFVDKMDVFSDLYQPPRFHCNCLVNGRVHAVTSCRMYSIPDEVHKPEHHKTMYIFLNAL